MLVSLFFPVRKMLNGTIFYQFYLYFFNYYKTCFVLCILADTVLFIHERQIDPSEIFSDISVKVVETLAIFASVNQRPIFKECEMFEILSLK